MQKNILFFLLLIAVVIAVPRQDHGSESIVMDVDAQMEEFTYHTDNSALSEESKGTNTTGSDTLLMDPRFLVSAASQDESTGESTYPLFQKQQEMTIKSGPLEGDSVPDNIQEEMPESIPQRQTSEDSPEGKAEASIQPEIYDPVTEAHDTAEGGRGENELQDEAQIEVRESNAYTKPIDAVDEQDGNELISEALMDKIRAIETVPQVVDYRNDTEALGTEMVREPAEEPTSAENLGGTKAENLQKTADEILLKKPTSQPDYPQNRTDVQEVEVEETTNETELIPTKADLPVSVTEQHITEVEQKGLQEISMKAETSAFVSEANEMTTGQPEIPESSTQETVQRIPVESTLQSTDADLQTGLTERGTGETTVQPQDSEASSDETESIVDVTPSQTDTQLVDVNSWKEPTDVKFDDSETQGKATGTSSIEESMEDASDFSIPERRTTPKAEAGVGAGDIRKPSSSPMFESSTLLSVKHPTENEGKYPSPLHFDFVNAFNLDVGFK